MEDRRTRSLIAFVSAMLLTIWAGVALAGAPYTVTIDNIVGEPLGTEYGTPDSWNFYIDDCAATGATGTPIGNISGASQTFTDSIALDGTYEICIRSVTAGGEQPDPGQTYQVIAADAPLGPPAQTFDVTVECLTDQGCVITVTPIP